MKRFALALPILLGVIVVLWGCSPYQSPGGGGGGTDRVLEERVSKLEKDLKTAKDQAAAELKAERAKVASAEKDRDESKAMLKLRLDDLTKAQGELDGVRKGLKELLGRVDAALAPAEAGVVSVK